MSTPWTGKDLSLLDRIALARVLKDSTKYNQLSANPWAAFELEILLTSPRSTALVNACDRVKSFDTRGYLTEEFQPYMLEGRPRLDQNIWVAKSMRRTVLDVVCAMRDACEMAHVRMMPVASGHAWSAKRLTLQPRNPNHRRMVEETMPGVGLGAVATGLQFHGCSPCSIDSDVYWRTILLLQQHAPYLLALSANSPRTEDHVFGSVRYLLSRSIWSFKLFSYKNFSEFVDMVFQRLQHGAIRGPHNLHGWVKPCVGSMEQRICDTPGSVAEMWTLIALMHALHVYCFEQAQNNPHIHLVTSEADRDELYLALENSAVFGLSDLNHSMLSPYEMRRYPMRDIFKEIGDRVGPVMKRLGYGWEYAYLFDKMLGGRLSGENGAERLRRWQRELHSPKLILNAAHEYFLESIDEASNLVGKID